MRPFLLLLISAAIAVLPPSAFADPSDHVISRITVRGTDIFDLDLNPKLRHFPYTTVNFLHVQTREEVIRRELLFKVGDRYDPFLVQETERNLRALSFIRAARVARFPQRDGTVALVVHVNDAWTTEPQINLGGKNGISETEVGFREKNLFGFGKDIQFMYKKGEDFTRRQFEYFDPRLGGTRFQLKARTTDETDGHAERLDITRPFFSADTRWSTRLSVDHSVYDLDEIEDNRKVSEFQQTKDVEEIALAFKVGGGRDVVTHAGLRYRQDDRKFDPNPGTDPVRGIPTDRRLETVFLDLDASRTNFIEMTHLEKMNRVEDLNLGPRVQISPGVSPSQLNDETDPSVLEGFFEKQTLFRAEHLLVQRLAYAGRETFTRGQNEKYEAALKYYHRPSDLHTLVVNTRVNWANDLDPDDRIQLGSDNGMRNHDIDRFIGTKSVLVNVEDRIFLVDEALNLFAVGAVVFVDSGYAWPRGRPVALSDMRTDIGTGLRLGLTRSSNEVIVRFDIAYRLQEDSREDSRFVFTFGTGQAF